MSLKSFFICAVVLAGASATTRAVELQIAPSSQPLIVVGTQPQSIRVQIETGLALDGLTVTLQLRRYDQSGKLAAPETIVSTADVTEDVRGGGGEISAQVSVPSTGFYELTAIATGSDGKRIALKKTVLAALAQ